MTARWAGLTRAILAAVVGALAVCLAIPAGTPAAWAADPAIGPPPIVVRHGPRTERVVALTFDDGYGPATVRRIFQVLVREKVPATFFVNGIYVKQDPDLWRRIAAAGYPIGNHTHRHRDMTTLTPDEIARDLARSRRAVEAATGRPMLPYVRPPFGARNAATDRAAAAAGFPTIVMWDVTAGDSLRHRTTVGSVVSAAAAGRPGSIVLLHAGPTVTARALPRIIARYRERGFLFVTVPELLGRREATATPPPSPAATPSPTPTAAPSPRPTTTPTALPTAVAAAPPPTAPSPRPVARDVAWARRDDTPATIAGGTAIGLLILLAAAAVAGRGKRQGGDGPA